MNPDDFDPEKAAEAADELLAGNAEVHAAAADYAVTLWTFYRSLTEQGFDSEQAFGLTVAMLTTMLGNLS